MNEEIQRLNFSILNYEARWTDDNLRSEPPQIMASPDHLKACDLEALAEFCKVNSDWAELGGVPTLVSSEAIFRRTL